jgi:Zn-dependent protease with chaperone function
MPTIEFILTYFTQPIPLAILGALTALNVACYLSHRSASSPKSRVKAHMGMLTSSLSTWSFISSSIIACTIYDYIVVVQSLEGEVKFALGVGGLTALMGGVLFSRWLSSRAAGIIRGPCPVTQTEELDGLLRTLASGRLPNIRVLRVDTARPLIAVVGDRALLFSTGLVKMLHPEELRAVLSHEIAHILGRHCWLKTLTKALRLLLPFDPFIRYVHRTLPRDLEMYADAYAASSLQAAHSLGSALIKIHEGYPRRPTENQPLAERLKRLINTPQQTLNSQA